MTPDTETQTERPILFKPWSMRRNLAGEKTETRRIANQDFRMQKAVRVSRTSDYKFDFIFEDDTGMIRESPYGTPGDVLWCREAFRLPDDSMSPKEYVQNTEPHDYAVYYEADDTINGAEANHPEGYGLRNWEGYKADFGRKRPSIYMPKELCRLRLRVEDVSVERIRDIDAEGAIAEGIPHPFDHNVMPDGLGSVGLDPDPRTIHELAFKALWNRIHGEQAWEKNQWVWVLKYSTLDT